MLDPNSKMNQYSGFSADRRNLSPFTNSKTNLSHEEPLSKAQSAKRENASIGGALASGGLHIKIFPSEGQVSARGHVSMGFLPGRGPP